MAARSESQAMACMSQDLSPLETFSSGCHQSRVVIVTLDNDIYLSVVIRGREMSNQRIIKSNQSSNNTVVAVLVRVRFVRFFDIRIEFDIIDTDGKINSLHSDEH